jgi:hypothetical protein
VPWPAVHNGSNPNLSGGCRLRKFAGFSAIAVTNSDCGVPRFLCLAPGLFPASSRSRSAGNNCAGGQAGNRPAAKVRELAEKIMLENGWVNRGLPVIAHGPRK